MGGEWREVVLEDVVKDVTVGHVGPMASEYVTAGIPFFRSQNIERLRINTVDLKFISAEFHERLKKSALSPGDVVIVRTGKPGACAVIPENFPVANCSDLVIVRCGEQVNPRFLAFYMNSVAAHHVDSHLVGAVQQHFNVGSARKLTMRLPEFWEQNAIARILGTLDDKIELNQRMNDTLEMMARALFKSWFVDFEPVRAKAEGQDLHPPRSAPNLFPDSVEAREAGEIPKGWRSQGLAEIARFLNGLALQKHPPINDRALPVIKIAQLRAGNTANADSASADLEPDYIVEDGDVLFSWSGSLECVLWTGGRGALNQHLFKVTSTGYPKWFYYLWIHHHLEYFRNVAAGKATTMGHIQRHHLTDARVVVPNDATLKWMDSIIAPILDQVVQRRIESRTIATLRDALLPQLISGKLRVKDVERVAEAV